MNSLDLSSLSSDKVNNKLVSGNIYKLADGTKVTKKLASTKKGSTVTAVRSRCSTPKIGKLSDSDVAGLYPLALADLEASGDTLVMERAVIDYHSSKLRLAIRNSITQILKPKSVPTMIRQFDALLDSGAINQDQYERLVAALKNEPESDDSDDDSETEESETEESETV